MNHKPFLFASLLVLLMLVLSVSGPILSAPPAAAALTGYYNLLGYEGIGTLGSNLLQNHGETPSVGDYVTTHCRYINVPNTGVGEYYLRYPLHLPNGANITGVSLFVADFNSTGKLWAYLRSRPWNSRLAGSTLHFTLTDDVTNSDKSINMGTFNVNVNNQTTEYWIDVSPNNGADPGQLCVYGIQVTYSIDGAFLPLIQNGS
jgi:hypothetical protein